jgi:DNA-binding response OmpR family regulator
VRPERAGACQKVADAQIPIVVLTAHAVAPDEQKARDAGCDDFATKPVNLSRLLTKIEAQLGDTTGSPDES